VDTRSRQGAPAAVGTFYFGDRDKDVRGTIAQHLALPDAAACLRVSRAALASNLLQGQARHRNAHYMPGDKSWHVHDEGNGPLMMIEALEHAGYSPEKPFTMNDGGDPSLRQTAARPCDFSGCKQQTHVTVTGLDPHPGARSLSRPSQTGPTVL